MGFDVKNKKCVVCEAYLFEEDDVVCCPVCGAPHHRDCYNSIGHCGLEQYHGTDLQYSEESSDSNSADTAEKESEGASGEKAHICTQCGKEYPHGARFCPHCGYSEMTGFFAEGNMSGFGGFNIVDDDTDIGEGVTAKEASEVISINHFRYLSRFLILNKNKKRSWNWAGFIFSGSWFAYRKMYKEGVIAVVFSIISTLLTLPITIALAQLPEPGQNVNMMNYYIDNLPSIGTLPLVLAGIGVFIFFAVKIISAMYGDWLYKNRVIHAAKELKKADSRDEDEKAAARKKWTGVSFVGFMIAFFSLDLISNIIVTFML